MNVLLGLTGSVASKLFDKIRTSLYQDRHEVRTIMTEKSKEFINMDDYWHDFYDDGSEWNNTSKVLHIDLVKWADAMVIAPCSANTLAKIANGICDNLLTCVTRAWDFEKKLIIAPSMNCNMWNHPITKQHIDNISAWGIEIVQPIEKKLFCGDFGIGAMANIEDICKKIQ